jgi:Flp pilus assembly protein TadG
MLQALRTTLHELARRVPRRADARRLARDEKGGAAVEFALVAAPFLALTFAIVETALIFFASQTLETVVADSARLIMTGQAQTQGFSQAQFADQVCNRIKGMFTCGNLIIDVQQYSNFASANTGLPVDAQGNLQINPAYSPGGPNCIVVVRVMYPWPVYVSLLGLSKSLSNMAGNKYLIMATAAFRNEPYQVSGGC